MSRKIRLRAFTLLESLVALLVISGSILVYQGIDPKHFKQCPLFIGESRGKMVALFSAAAF